MSVQLPVVTGGGLLSDYAAESTNINRAIKNIGGIMTAVFSCQLGYKRTDYLLNSRGEKVGIVSTDASSMPMYPPDPAKGGSVSISPDKLNEMFAKDPKFLDAFLYVSEVEDQLIREQLIENGILPKAV